MGWGSEQNPHRKALVKMVADAGRRRERWTVFADFCELAALSLANAVDLVGREEREARYGTILAAYDASERERFPRMLAEVVNGLELEATDLLGGVFHDLELHNKYRGQHFTPFHVSRLMAQLALPGDEAMRAHIARHGFITLEEPACGAGSMVIGMAEAMRERGFNYQQVMHVTATDVDSRAAHMAYIQLSLLHIPAYVVIGNSLSLECREVWRTPAHVLGGWERRLSARAAIEDAKHLLAGEVDRPALAVVPGTQLAMF